MINIRVIYRIMDIKLDQYKAFNAVAKCSSFSLAASELYMTQSAISQQIKALEEALGVTLFIRGRNGATLTPQGKILFEYVQKALDLFTSAENNLAKLSELESGSLCIAAGDTISKHFLLPALEKFNTAYPKIKLQIINRVTSEAIELLKSGKADIAVINLPFEDDSAKHGRLNIRSVHTIHDVFVAGTKFSQYQNEILSCKQISELPLIMLEEKSNSRLYVDGFFACKSITLQPEIELGSHDLLLEFAAANLGVSCVIKEFATDFFNSGKIFELKTDEFIPSRNIGICTLEEVTTSAATDKFLSFLESF
jgi:DNA-binding transcriptional LysR family regulator